MSNSHFRIDIAKISFELKKANPDFMKKHLDKITGKSYVTIDSWQKEAPDVIKLLYSLSQSFDFDFNKMIMASSDTYPVVKLLKHYRNETKNDFVQLL